MKTLAFAFLGLVVFLSVLSEADSKKKKKKKTGDVTLYCRGGGALKAEYSVITPRPTYKKLERPSPWFRRLAISFERAPRSARAGVPGPGQCTLEKRGIGKSQPNMLRKSWETKHPTLRRGARPGQWVSLLKITPTSISIGKVEGAELDLLIRAISRTNMIFTVRARPVSAKTSAGDKTWWEISSVGKSLNVSDWAKR